MPEETSNEALRAVGERLAAGTTPMPRLLEELADADAHGGELLLERALEQWWEELRDRLPALPGPPDFQDTSDPDSDQVAPALVYLVLSLAPNGARRLTEADLRFVVDACGYDLNLLRYLLTWAAAQPAADLRQWQLDGRPPPMPAWALVAEVVRKHLPNHRWRHHDRTAWSRFAWATDSGVAMARRVLGSVDLGALLNHYGPRFFFTRMDLVIELSKLSGRVARRAAADPAVTGEFLEAADRATRWSNWLTAEAEPTLAAVAALLPLTTLEGQPRRAGWLVGAMLHARGLPATPAGVAQLLGRRERELEVGRLTGMALLWADLRQLVGYQKDRWSRRDEIRGVLARLTEHLQAWPDAWADSARQLLHLAGALGTEVSDLLALAAVRHPTVRQAVKEVSEQDADRETRDRARGLLAQVDGVPTAGGDLRRWLADSAARAFDGVPLFPHPLTRLSATWLGSNDVEETLSRSLRQAIDRFGGRARSQGAAQEELLTGALLVELEHAFGDTSMRLEAAGWSRLARIVTVGHRPVPKVEEKRWGCDIALLLNADIRPTVDLQLAELVQVKKSESFAASSPPSDERWRIDLPQLETLLEMSESSAYWLILSTGELVCVSARWLQGLARGRGVHAQKSVTVGYNDVRHTAVPLEQFLSELFVGTWVGSVREPTLRFARGQDGSIQPRHIFEITVTVERG